MKMAKKKTKAGTSYEESLIKRLKGNEKEQRAYLQASFRDNADMPTAILRALRHVAEARGFTTVAAKARLSRESLYRTLSMKGNPKMETLYKILDSFGLQLSVEPKSKVG
jgi:probable addiction module antidote protein